MNKPFISPSQDTRKPISQIRLYDMIDYLRQLALYRKTNYKTLSKKELGKITTEVLGMEKKIMSRLNFSEYLIEKQPKEKGLLKNA